VKILLALHAFPPFSRAGSENYVEALACELLRRHEVTVFHRVSQPERPEYETSEARHGAIPVVRINRSFSDMTQFRDSYRSDMVAKRFAAVLDRLRPDVVHFHHLTCLSTTCVDAARQLGIPVVCTLHDYWLLCPRGQLLRRDLSLCERHTDSDCVRCMAYQLNIHGGHQHTRKLFDAAARLARWRLPADIYRRIASRPFAREDDALGEIRERTREVLEACSQVDRFVSPSQFLRERYAEFGVPAARIEVLRNGFDATKWPAPRAARPRDTSTPLRVIYLGTWIPSKGVHVLLEAVRSMDPREIQLEVHGHAVPFEGVENYEGQLQRLAAGAPHIRMGERYAPDDVPALLAAADVAVVPSIWYENAPLTIQEAFRAGLPVVASGHGGLLEFVAHERNGLTFRPGSSAALRAALERLAREPGLLDRLRAGVPAVVTMHEHALELERLYAELCAGMSTHERVSTSA